MSAAAVAPSPSPSRPVGVALVDHAPVVYRLTQRKAREMSTEALREAEQEMQGRIRWLRAKRVYAHLDWVRLYALRHELTDRGVSVADLC